MTTELREPELREWAEVLHKISVQHPSLWQRSYGTAGTYTLVFPNQHVFCIDAKSAKEHAYTEIMFGALERRKDWSNPALPKEKEVLVPLLKQFIGDTYSLTCKHAYYMLYEAADKALRETRSQRNAVIQEFEAAVALILH